MATRITLQEMLVSYGIETYKTESGLLNRQMIHFDCRGFKARWGKMKWTCGIATFSFACGNENLMIGTISSRIFRKHHFMIFVNLKTIHLYTIKLPVTYENLKSLPFANSSI